jgi:hypothetical protein
MDGCPCGPRSSLLSGGVWPINEPAPDNLILIRSATFACQRRLMKCYGLMRESDARMAGIKKASEGFFAGSPKR